jgi:hypothetical protein
MAALSCVVGTALTLGAWLSSTPIARADPIIPQAGSESASATVTDLMAAGYGVDVNYVEGTPNVPLSECRVTAIRNFNGPMAALMMLSSVAVDVACPNAK